MINDSINDIYLEFVKINNAYCNNDAINNIKQLIKKLYE